MISLLRLRIQILSTGKISILVRMYALMRRVRLGCVASPPHKQPQIDIFFVFHRIIILNESIIYLFVDNKLTRTYIEGYWSREINMQNLAVQ